MCYFSPSLQCLLLDVNFTQYYRHLTMSDFLNLRMKNLVSLNAVDSAAWPSLAENFREREREREREERREREREREKYYYTVVF